MAVIFRISTGKLSIKIYSRPYAGQSQEIKPQVIFPVWWEIFSDGPS